MKRRHLLAYCAAAALAAGLGAAPAQAQQKQVLKAADVHPLGYPTVEAVERMGKKLNVFTMPFVFRDAQHMRKVIDGDIGKEMAEKVTANPNTKLVFLAWMDAGSRNVYTTKAIRKPDDLKGLKIRMMGNPIFVDTMNAMGGNGIAMGFNELFSALQTGVVDGAENNPPTLLAQNHFQTPAGKIFSMTEHLIIPEILVYSRRSWDALSKEDQALVAKFGRETQMEQRQLWDAYTTQAVEKLKASGVTIVTDVDKKAFQASVDPVWKKYGSKYDALVKRIQAVQ